MAKFGVKPAALPDLFGLVGDVADNIPGEKATRGFYCAGNFLVFLAVFVVVVGYLSLLKYVCGLCPKWVRGYAEDCCTLFADIFVVVTVVLLMFFELL